MKVKVSIEVRDHFGATLRRMQVATHSPIPTAVAIAAALKKEFGDDLTFGQDAADVGVIELPSFPFHREA